MKKYLLTTIILSLPVAAYALDLMPVTPSNAIAGMFDPKPTSVQSDEDAGLAKARGVYANAISGNDKLVNGEHGCGSKLSEEVALKVNTDGEKIRHWYTQDGFNNFDCLDKYSKINPASILKMPDLSSLAQQLESAVCQAVDKKVTQQMKPLSQDIGYTDPTTGAAVGGSVGPVFGDSGGHATTSSGQVSIPQNAIQ